MANITFLKRLTTPVQVNTNIYTLKPVKINEKSIVETSKNFKLTGKKTLYTFTRFPNFFRYQEGPTVLDTYPASGALRHFDVRRWQVDDGHVNVDIPDDQAVELAKKYIKDTNFVPLNECSVLRITRLRAGTMKVNGESYEERIIDIGVIFQRTLDKIPVEGPGGKAVIYLDYQGQVTGTYRLWREIDQVKQPVPYQQLQSPKFAEDHLTKYWTRPTVTRVNVAETRFGYFELGEGASQEIMQPVYIMPFTFVSPDEHIVMKSVHVVPASTVAVGKIMPKPKVMPPPPPPRQ